MLTLTNVTVNNNVAGKVPAGNGGNNAFGGMGGGIFTILGIATLTNCTVSGNQTGTTNGGTNGYGGGIDNECPMTITGSTISGNTGNVAGAILNRRSLTVTNSTFSGNHTFSGFGNGVESTDSGSALRVTNCTITGSDGGGINASESPTVRNTIIAGNSGSTDVSGTFNSQGHNLIGKSSGSNGFTNGSNGDQVGTVGLPLNPLLAALSNNGGPTLTHAVLPGSVAIDAGDNCVAQAAHCGDANIPQLTTDQRGAGFNRSEDGNGDGIATVDIGAYEVQSILVTNTADVGTGSLRQALTGANASPGTKAINFQAGLTGTIALLSALPDLSTSMSINGPGANLVTVQRSTDGGTPNFRIFTVQSGVTVNISGLGISGGKTDGHGGGIFSMGTLTLRNSTVNGNSSNGGRGGGIYNNFGTVMLTNSTVSSNIITNGGAGGGIFNNSGTLTLTNSTVSVNSANSGFGGGIYNGGTLTLTNSTVIGNSANSASGYYGGGIYTTGSSEVTVTLTDSTVSGNSAGGGGGIGSFGTVTLTNSTVSGNTASNGDGGGISTFNNPTTNIKNTIVANNTVGPNGSGPDLSGTFNSQDYNLIGITAGASFTGTTAHNITNVNALLGQLANNGGATQTMALLPGSPAINAGDNCVVLASGSGGCLAAPLTTDQRGAGFGRQVNGTVDIGAFESRGFTIAATGGTPQSATITTAFSSPLFATVSSAFGEPVTGGQVSFTAPGSGAGGTFPGSLITTPVSTNGSGVATSPTFTANAIPGGPYNVVASLSGGSLSANFALTNTKAATTTTVASSVNPSDFGQSVTFTATVSSVGTPAGTVQFMDGVTNLGSATCMAGAGNTCTAQVSTSALTIGTHTISATYSGDANFVGSNGTLSGGQVVKPQPTLSINDVSMAEGNSGTTSFVFTVTLSAASNLTVNVDYATANGTAILFNSDYQATSGTLTFNPGDSTRTIVVLVNGDLNRELDETFFVNLTNALNATISRNQGVGTILNDDAQDPPQLILDESGPDPNQAAAFDSLLLVRDPFRVLSVAEWFDLGSDRNTRVLIFVANLQLNQGETASSVKVNLIGSDTHSYDVTAEDVRLLPNTGFAQVRFRLPDNLSAGACTVTVKAHGQSSNSAIIRIGP